MATDYFYNPLGYDEQIVAEKLGMYEYTPKPENDVNINLKMALLKEELESSKRQVDQLRRSNKSQKRETFVADKSEGFNLKDKPESDILDNKKLLLFLVVILVVFCVVQYFSYRNETKEMMEMMCLLLQSKGLMPTQAIQPASAT